MNGPAILRAMYLPFFGLNSAPFSIAPDPRYLFMSERHREALAHLLYGLGGGGGFVLLSGAIGAGKTTVCRCFLEQVPPSCHVAYIFNPKLSVRELLQSVCDEFGVSVKTGQGSAPSVKDYLDPLNHFLLGAHAQGRQCVLVIDEAQMLSARVLEQLRLLTNLETNERKLLQIILIGQPELRALLAQPALEQLAQRVIARFHLDALSEAETRAYVAHRLAVAGLRLAMPFDAPALRQLHRATGGVPRRINLLADRALLGAYATGRQQVDRAIVEQAAREVFDPATAAGRRPRHLLAGLAGLAALSVMAGLGWWLLSATPASADLRQAAASSPAAGPQVSAAAASAPAASAPAADVPSVLPAAPLFDVSLDTARLPHDEQALWRELASAWGLSLPGTGDACALAALQQLSCHRHANATLALVRQFDRPVLLSLNGPRGATVFARLVALDTRHAELAVGEQRWRLPLPQLARLWRGEFATLWRSPAGYERPLALGATGPAVQALAQSLAAQDGRPAPDSGVRLDEALRQRLAGFQLAQGLQPDGLAGPTTFMMLNHASGVAEPRLPAVTAGASAPGVN